MPGQGMEARRPGPSENFGSTIRQSGKTSPGQPGARAAQHPRGRTPFATGAQHTTYSTRSDTQPSRFAYPYATPPGHCHLVTTPSAHHTIPHHNTPHHTTVHHTDKAGRFVPTAPDPAPFGERPSLTGTSQVTTTGAAGHSSQRPEIPRLLGDDHPPPAPRERRPPERWDSVTPSVRRHATAEHWPLGLLEGTATLLGSSGQWVSFSALPHCWRAVSNRSPSVHSHAAQEQLIVGLLMCTATLLGAVGTGLLHVIATLPGGQQAVGFFLYSVTPLGSSGRWMIAPKRSGIAGRGNGWCPLLPCTVAMQ